MENIITAALIGLALSPSWLCGLFSFSMASIHRRAAANFIVGRILGLCVLALLIAIIGSNIPISPRVMYVAFGFLSVIFGIWIVFLERSSNAHACGLPGNNNNCNNNLKLNKLGFWMGFCRGATPCVKVLPVILLFVGLNPLNAAVIILVFALTSTIYPIIGFISANVFKDILSKRSEVKWLSAAVMVIIGIYYIVKGFGGCSI